MSLLRGAEALPAAVNAQLAALAQRGMLTAEELAAIDPGDILAFLRSDMGARMLASRACSASGVSACGMAICWCRA